LLPGTHNSVADQWFKLAQETSDKLPADNLYIGRATNEVKKTAKILNAEIAFASSGFGLIDARTELPNYDLTVADRNDPIRTKVINEEFSSQTWWNCVNQRSKNKSLATRLKESPDLIILLTLPKAYLELIKHELDEIGSEYSDRLRIFTSPDNFNVLPESVRHSYIPYDERFDGLDSPIPGTRSDYPQRILRHFAESIIKKDHPDIELEKELVIRALHGMKLRVKVDRTQVSDEEIRNIIRHRLDESKISGAKMLRVLRDELLISCEQKRFANIFRELSLTVK
jgi:hypothetical protein